MSLLAPHSLSALLHDVIQVLIILIIVDSIIMNIIAFGGRISLYHPVVRFIRNIVNPILDPVRRMLPPRKTQGWDLSPLIVIVLLSWLQAFLY